MHKKFIVIEIVNIVGKVISNMNITYVVVPVVPLKTIIISDYIRLYTSCEV